MSDLQAMITGRDNGASAAIDQSTKAMERLEKQTRKVTKETRDLQREIKDGYKQSGAAVAKAGGSIGSVGGRVLGGAGMDGGVGRAAVGFGLLSAAVMAYGKVMEAVTDQTQKAIDAARNLDAARDKGQKGSDAGAAAGGAQGPTVRAAIALGGLQAENLIAILEKAGIGTGEAAAGTMAIAGRKPRELAEQSPEIERLTRYAVRLSSLGMDFSEAIDGLLKGGGHGNDDHVQAVAARLYRDFSGGRGNPQSMMFGAINNVAQSKYLADEETGREISGAIPGVQRGRSGALPGLARDALSEATDPLSAAMVESNRLLERQLTALDRLADGQANFLTNLWEKTTGKIGTSAGQEAARIRNGQADALFAPGR